MFTIRLDLVGDSLSGIEALEVRRRLGLPDGSDVFFDSSRTQAGTRHPSCNVDEAFARAWFGPQQTESTVRVPYSLLVAGDVEPISHNGRVVTWAALTPERMRDLYVAVRFAGCRAEVERLTRERDELRVASDEDESDE